MIIITLIEHAAWPLTAAIAFIFFFIFGFHEKLESLQIGNFKVVIKNAAKENDAIAELKELSKLTNLELQYFLALGGESGDGVVFKYPIHPHKQEELFKKLVSVGLFTTEPTERQGAVEFRPTRKSIILHEKIMSNLFA